MCREPRKALFKVLGSTYDQVNQVTNTDTYVNTFLGVRKAKRGAGAGGGAQRSQHLGNPTPRAAPRAELLLPIPAEPGRGAGPAARCNVTSFKYWVSLNTNSKYQFLEDKKEPILEIN